MNYRRFGRTGLSVSELVFGGGWVGGLLIDRDDETKLEALRRAMAAGINWIDTAPSYGDGESERAMGRLLGELDEAPYVSTKVRLDLSKLNDVRGQVEASLTASLERLKLDSVELLQLHNKMGMEMSGDRIGVASVVDDVADALDAMREQGLTRHVGITGLGESRAVIEAINSGRFDSAQVYYNVINPTAAFEAAPAVWSGQDFSGVLAACTANDTAAMVIRIFAAGVLASEQRHGREIPVAEGADMAAEEARARAVAGVLKPEDGPLPRAAIRFALANSSIACIVVGMAQLEHLDSALEAAKQRPVAGGDARRLA